MPVNTPGGSARLRASSWGSESRSLDISMLSKGSAVVGNSDRNTPHPDMDTIIKGSASDTSPFMFNPPFS